MIQSHSLSVILVNEATLLTVEKRRKDMGWAVGREGGVEGANE